MILLVFSVHGNLYLDEEFLRCVESGREACVQSYEHFRRATELLVRGKYDSAYVNFRLSFDLLEGVDLPHWKTYLLYILIRSGVRSIYIIDYRFPDSAEISEYLQALDSLSRLSYLRPLYFVGKKLYNVHVAHLPPLSDTIISFFNWNVRTHEPVPVYAYYSEFTTDTLLSPYFNLEILAFNWLWRSMNYGLLREEDLQFLRELLDYGGPELRASYYAIMGRLLAQKGYYESARMYAWHLEKLRDSIESKPGLVILNNGIGDFYLIFLKNLMQSLNYYLSALDILDSLGVRHAQIYATINNNTGMAYYHLGEYEKGIHFLRRALKVQREIVGGLDSGASNMMSNLARAFYGAGMYDSAIFYTVETIKLRKRIYGRNSDQVLLKMLELAKIHMRLGDTSEARRILTRAREIEWDPSKSIYPPFYIYARFLELYETFEEKDSAYFYLNLILSDSSSMQATFIPFYLLEKIVFMLSMNEDSSVVDSVEILLDEVLNRVRGLTFVSPYDRKRILSILIKSLSEAIPLMVRRGVSAGKIIEVSEYFKGRLLMEDVAFSSDRVVDSLNRLLYAMTGKGSSIEEIAEVERSIGNRRWMLRKRFQMQEIPVVNEGTAMLGFVVSDSFLISYLMSRSDTDIYMVPILRDSLAELVRRYLSNPDIRTYSELLYHLTLSPWENRLEGYKRVVLSLHDFLRNVSFISLFSGEDYVVEHPYSLYRVFSFYSYDEPCRVGGPVLAVGRNFPASGAGNIGKLVYAEREAARVMDIMGGDLEWGNFSDKGEFQRGFSDYRLLHFATHIVVDDTPRILLEDDGDGVQQINIFDVISTMRVGDAVVLSGCRSGTGKPINEWEGLMNLTRAFVYAGARCVVTSLWEVNDLATYIYMSRFYKALKEGETMDMALKEAALYMLRNTGLDSPVYWGAFTLTVFRR